LPGCFGRCGVCQLDTDQYRHRKSTGTGNPLSFSATASEAGVTFSTSVTLGDGVGLNLTSDASGTGVNGGAASNAINNGQVLLVNAPTINSVTGGTVTFDGFTAVSLTGFDFGDTGLVDGNAFANNGFALLGANPTTFTLIGTGDAAGSPGFQAAGLFGDFTVTPTAVPEPSSMAAMAITGIGGVVGRRRRRAKAAKTQPASV